MKSSTLAALLRGSAAFAIGVLAVVAILMCAGFVFELMAGTLGVDLRKSLGINGPGSYLAMGFGVTRFGLQSLLCVTAVALLLVYLSGDLYARAHRLLALRRR